MRQSSACIGLMYVKCSSDDTPVFIYGVPSEKLKILTFNVLPFENTGVP